MGSGEPPLDSWTPSSLRAEHGADPLALEHPAQQRAGGRIGDTVDDHGFAPALGRRRLQKRREEERENNAYFNGHFAVCTATLGPIIIIYIYIILFKLTAFELLSFQIMVISSKIFKVLLDWTPFIYNST